MFDVFKEFSTSDKAEQEGVWCDIGGDAKILVARAGNRAYGRMLTALVEKSQRILDSKTEAATKLSDDIMLLVTASTVLLGWSGVAYKGAELAYSVENAKKVLALKDFRKLVGELSNDVERYRGADEEAVAGN